MCAIMYSFRGFYKFILIMALALSFYPVDRAMASNMVSPGSAENLIADTEYLTEMSELLLEHINQKLSEKPPIESLSKVRQMIRRAAYLVARSSNYSESFLNASLINYPDVAKVNLGLHITTAIITPILIYTGNSAWLAVIHFPGLEGMFTGAYFLTRKWAEKRAEIKRFKMNPSDIKDFKNEVFTDAEVKTINLHILSDDFSNLEVPISRPKFKLSKKQIKSDDFITLKELETLINDEDFLHEARGLRLDTSLYEEILIQKIISEPNLKISFFQRVQSLNKSKVDPWSEWIKSSESYLNKVRSEAMLQGFDRKRLVAKDRIEYLKSFWASREARKTLYSQIRDIELLQLDTLALHLRGEAVDLSLAEAKFSEQRQALISGFNDYQARYPLLKNNLLQPAYKPAQYICRDLFLMPYSIGF